MIPPGIRRVFRLPTSRARLARELDDEMRFHLDERIAALVAGGMNPDEARTEALRRFGDADDLREYCDTIETTNMRRLRFNEWMESLRQDFHFALRQVRRSPGFAAVVIITLAFGLGATTAIFTVVDSVLLRPLPYPQPDRIVQIWEVNKKGRSIQVADPNFADFRAQSRSFSAMAQVANYGLSSVSGGAEPVRANTARVSRDFFSALGVRPMRGRLFVDAELHQGGAPAAVVSHAFWEQTLGGSSSALGKRLNLGDISVTVVGVMPPELDFPEGTDLWIPSELTAPLPSRTAHNWEVVGRLAPGVTLEQARSEMTAIARRIRGQYGDEVSLVDASVVPLQEQLVGDTRHMLLLLLGASAVLLLIACANVANLLIARMSSRNGEIAVRLALGAARGRLLQQFLIESLALSLAAGACGLLLAMMGVRALVALQPSRLPRAAGVHMDWAVLAFAFAVSLAIAVGLGLSAAWRVARSNIRDQLAQQTRTISGASHRVRSALVMAQVSLTLVLLVGAGLLGRSFVRLLTVNPGFRTDSAVVLDIAAEIGTKEARGRFYDALIERLRAIPGVTSVGATNRIPLGADGQGDGTFLVMSRLDEAFDFKDLPRLAQDPDHSGQAEFRLASADYFKTMRIPLVAGRVFSDGDGPGAPHVAVVSASLAKERWANGNPIGKVIQFGNMDGDLTPFTVVGVVGDIREKSLATVPRPTFYANYRQRPGRTWQFNLVMVHTGAPGPIIAAARQAVRELRPDVPPRFRTMSDIVAGSVTDRRFVLFLVGVFGVVALALASLGVYSVISYLVTQRSRELSIRVALGARSQDVIRLVLRQGVGLAAGGIIIGTVASVVATRLIADLLFDVSRTDPVSFASVIALLAGVALAASWIPARRAARVAPMDVLRNA